MTMHARNLSLKKADGNEFFDFSLQLKLADPGKDVSEGTIEGYGSVFKLLDRGGDIVMPGAFKASLADWKRKSALPPMLWQHDPSNPIGVWTEMIEDEHGLKVRGELILDVPQGKIAHSLVKKGAMNGLSIGYRTRDYEYDRNTGARRLKKVDLWELSLVTMPMLEEAQISGIKNDQSNFNPREVEASLREAGLSRADAVKATAVLRDWFQRDAGTKEAAPRDEVRDALMELRKLNQAIRN